MQRFLNRLPTITIREGHRVKVYLTSDLELPAYDARPSRRVPHPVGDASCARSSPLALFVARARRSAARAGGRRRPRQPRAGDPDRRAHAARVPDALDAVPDDRPDGAGPRQPGRAIASRRSPRPRTNRALGVRAAVAAGPEQRRRRGRAYLQVARRLERPGATARAACRPPRARRSSAPTRRSRSRTRSRRWAATRSRSCAATAVACKRRSTRSNATSSSTATGYHETTAILDKIAAGQLVARRAGHGREPAALARPRAAARAQQAQRDTEAAAMNMRLGGLRDGRAAARSVVARRRARPAHVAPAVREEAHAHRAASSSSSLLVVPSSACSPPGRSWSSPIRPRPRATP